MTSAIDRRRYASTRGLADGGSSSMELPLLGRKRHQTAIVSSRVRAELKFISWPQIMALSRTSRIIFEKLREAATVRANATGEDTDHKHHEQKRGLVDTLFAQFDQQNVSAKTIQRRWRRRTAAECPCMPNRGPCVGETEELLTCHVFTPYSQHDSA